MSAYLVQKNLVEEIIPSNTIGENNLQKLYVDNFNEKYDLVINSFKNKCLLVEKDLMKKKFISTNILEYLETPNLKNRLNFVQTYTNEINKIKQSCKNISTFIIAITYTCNLKCSYCYQQWDTTLNKKLISEENLYYIFDTILKYKKKFPNKVIELGLFGGEPLLPTNIKIIKKIFDFCVENKFKISITTNGYYLDYYAKFLVIHRGVISVINTTIDSIEFNHIRRGNNKGVENKGSHSEHLLNCIKTLLYYEVNVNLSSNMDALNIHSLKDMYDYLLSNDFFSLKYFSWDIGRVDDRLYETDYPNIISEADILVFLNKLDIKKHSNIKAAFLKTSFNLCKMVGMDFNQKEFRGLNNYCWASSPIDNVFYIDSDLNTFRCTYTVGRLKNSEFKFDIDNILCYSLPDRNYLNHEDCYNCYLGGYCSSGCALSYKKDKHRFCTEEKKNFQKFVDLILKPYINKRIQQCE